MVPTMTRADALVRALENASIAREEISVVSPNPERVEGRLDVDESPEQNVAVDAMRDYAPASSVDAHTAVTAGGAVGGILGLFVGMMALIIPGVGAIVAAGPILGLLGGAAAGAGVGTLTNLFTGMSIPEVDAQRLEQKIQAGHVLISVHATTRDAQDRVRAIYEQQGAEDIYSDDDWKPSTTPTALPDGAIPATAIAKSSGIVIEHPTTH